MQRGGIRDFFRLTPGSDFNSCFPAFCVPKLTRVRTLTHAFLLSVSEVNPGSDSSSRLPAFCVRSWTRFGLYTWDFHFLCPKSTRVRTLAHAFLLFVSEVGQDSDSNSRTPAFCVRSWTGFGLYTSDFHFLCPKSTRVRTLTRAFLSFVSEVEPGSDSTHRISTFCVRSQLGFGL